MADIHNQITRSYNMAQIRSKNTGPELLVRKFLYANKIRYRLHVKKLPGTPDIVIKNSSLIIFVNGCFWHSHKNCRKATMPISNSHYWQNKLSQNIEKDAIVIAQLQSSGWQVITVWECELEKSKIEITLMKLLAMIRTVTQEK